MEPTGIGDGTQVQAFLFDVGGTLLESTRSFAEVWADAAGPPVAPEAIRTAVGAVLADRVRPEGAVTLEQSQNAWTETFSAALAELTYPGDIKGAAERMWSASIRSGMRVFPEVPEVLATLRRRGHRLAVVSNWAASLEQTLVAMGLRDFFEVVICSTLIGIRKPDPGIFVAAARALNLRPKDCAYVGDDFALDVVGARSAGMAPILIKRAVSSECGDPGCQVVSTLRSLI